MRDFYKVLGNTLFSTVANFFVWFALTFWLYLETRSVLVSSFVGGLFLVATAASGFWFGAIVDHHRKKVAMMFSSVATLIAFAAALLIYRLTPAESFKSASQPLLWLLVFAVLCGVTAGSIRTIALPTLTTLLIPDAAQRERANGLTGTVMGIASSGAGFSSGFALAHLGMAWVLMIGIACAALALLHLAWSSIAEPPPATADTKHGLIDLHGTVHVIRSVPGLIWLIFFSAFNNLLGGIFMALMDPYGLSLVSVQAWGALWGVISTGFVIGGLYVARFGLGGRPLRRMLLTNLIMWGVATVFTLQPSIELFAIGMSIWVLVVPTIEAAEQSTLQKVVPIERQGRVFGLAQSVEMGAAPLTAFLIGPLTQLYLIPFMTTGSGVALIGDWFGVGPSRGMALAFIGAGFIGVVVTLLALRSRSYRRLSRQYEVTALASAQ